MRLRSLVLGAIACASLFPAGAAQKKKSKEEQTQVLQLPKELPTAIAGDTRRLTFHVTPLTAKGLLSPQIREALKALSHEAGGDTILKIRAFVAGSGDARRVRDLVSAYYSEHRQPLPVLSLIRAGGLPLEGAQVVLEAVAQARRDVNPAGLAFLSGQPAVSANPLDPPPAKAALATLSGEVKAAGAEAAGVVRVTCFLSSLAGVAAVRDAVLSEYPNAAADFVQTQREPGSAVAACEAVARLSSDPGRLRLGNVDNHPAEAGQSDFALVGAPQLIFTGTQVSFGYQEQDGRLAFQRLGKELAQAGASFADLAYLHCYPLAEPLAAQVRKLRLEFLNGHQPPAGTLLLFEGLPAMDAGFAVDAIAVK